MACENFRINLRYISGNAEVGTTLKKNEMVLPVNIYTNENFRHFTLPTNVCGWGGLHIDTNKLKHIWQLIKFRD